MGPLTSEKLPGISHELRNGEFHIFQLQTSGKLQNCTQNEKKKNVLKIVSKYSLAKHQVSNKF